MTTEYDQLTTTLIICESHGNMELYMMPKFIIDYFEYYYNNINMGYNKVMYKFEVKNFTLYENIIGVEQFLLKQSETPDYFSKGCDLNKMKLSISELVKWFGFDKNILNKLMKGKM